MSGYLAKRILQLTAATLTTGVCCVASAEEGTVPNRSYTPDQLNQIISPWMGGEKKYNQPGIVNGWLLLAGNAQHRLYDIQDPFAPKEISKFDSPHHSGEAESHQITFKKTKDGRHLAALINGLGIDTWDLTDAENPRMLGVIDLEGVDYGDNTNAVWGVAWQGDYIYAGGTNTGLHVVDASDPENLSLVKLVPTSEFGGVSAGTVFAVGNLLVIGTPKEHAGIATLDISDPGNPALLDFVIPETESYIGHFFGKHAYLLTPFRTYDVTTDPRNIALLGQSETPKSEYMSFADGKLFLGALRPKSGNHIFDISDPNNLKEQAYIKGRDVQKFGGLLLTDDQFSLPVGNLLVIGDDEVSIGAVIAVHDTERDTRGPSVVYTNPPDGAVNQALTSRIGISFDDQIDLRSVDPDTLIVRPLGGGAALTGEWGHNQTLINFWPDAPLEVNTSYEIVIPSGGITDLVGNPIDGDFSAVFTTGADIAAPDCQIADPIAVEVNKPAELTPAANTVYDAYKWDFGDGSTATTAGTSHAFKKPGRYPITLTVENEGLKRTCSALQIVHRKLTAERPTQSSTVIVDDVGGHAWTVNPDADTITRVSLDDLTDTDEYAACDHPTTLAMAGDSLWVACQDSDELLEFDATAGKVKQRHALRWGARPYGVAASPDGKSLWVSAEGAGELLRVNTADGSVSETVTFGEAGARPAVRGVAVSGDGKRVFVTRFISSADEGQVYEVDAKSGEVTKEHAIVTDSTSKDEQNSGRGVANYISSIVLSPDGVRATVPAKKDNTLRGVTRDGEALTTDNTVRTIVSQLDLEGGGELFEARLDLDDHDMAFAATYSAVGDVVFVVSQGTNKVDVFDAYSGRTVGGASTGLAPQGVALSKDGKLFVQSFMSRRLDVFDVTGLLAGIDSAPKRLAEVSTVAKESLSDEELLGKQIFYNADSPQMSRSGYVACSTCHLDGGQDGRVWDFTDRGEGLRNTISLRGRAGTGHGPVHWTANFDEIQDFENDMRAHFGGSGLMTNEQFDDGDRSDPLGAKKAGVSKSLDALAAYVTSLDTFPRSPYREADGSLSDAAKRGQALFNRLDCRTCHAGEPMTDSGTELHDVGTIKETSGTRRGEKLEGIDTPTLRGLHATAPYLHDGSAATLLDVIDNAKHGNAATLSATQKDDLVQYLLSIENEELGEWAGPAKTGDNLEGSGCGCRAAGRDEPTPIGWLLATLGLWAVRRRRGA